MNLVEAAALTKYFGATKAVDNLSLAVAEGEIYGLVGPDGAGKTTLLRLLCGALLPERKTDGQKPCIEIGGLDMLRQTELGRAQLGYLPQRFSLYEELSVMQNLRFFAEVRGLATHEWLPRCREILEFVGLADAVERRAGRLSGGMKQKLGLAVALVHRPRVLLLDEPTTGVDPVTRQDFWQLIIRMTAEQKVSVLVSTPYMDEAARCGRIGFMKHGRLEAEGTPESLRRLLDERIVELRGQPLPQLRILAAADPGVQDVQMFGDRLHLRVSPGQAPAVLERLGQALADASMRVDRLRSIPPQLEDVFIAMLAEKPANGQLD